MFHKAITEWCLRYLMEESSVVTRCLLSEGRVLLLRGGIPVITERVYRLLPRRYTGYNREGFTGYYQ